MSSTCFIFIVRNCDVSRCDLLTIICCGPAVDNNFLSSLILMSDRDVWQFMDFRKLWSASLNQVKLEMLSAVWRSILVWINLPRLCYSLGKFWFLRLFPEYLRSCYKQGTRSIFWYQLQHTLLWWGCHVCNLIILIYHCQLIDIEILYLLLWHMQTVRFWKW